MQSYSVVSIRKNGIQEKNNSCKFDLLATGSVTTERNSNSKAKLEPMTPVTSVTRFNDGATSIQSL